MTKKQFRETNNGKGRAQRFSAIDPEQLRDRVRKALMGLSVIERAAIRDEILDGLYRAGANVAADLFALGIMAKTPSELTPTDVAYLVRYVRINSPERLAAIAEALDKLLSSEEEQERNARLAA